MYILNIIIHLIFGYERDYNLSASIAPGQSVLPTVVGT